MSGTATVERILRHDRMIVGTGLALVAGIAWLYRIAGAGVAGTQQGMDEMGGMAMAPLPWSATHAAMIALMWFVMMIAMMTPSAAPMILLFAAVNRKQRQQSQPYVATSFFVLGYLAVWSMFSVLATLLQWALQANNMLSPLMASTSTALAARGAAIGRAAGLLLMASGAALMIVEADGLRAGIAAALSQ